MKRHAFAIMLLAVGVGASAALGACAGTDDPSASEPEGTTTTTSGPPYPVERHEEVFVDESRPTIGPDGTELAASRTLVTDVYVPSGDGPFPLIVHAHGLDGHPRKFTELLTAWAEAGYVVVAPAFPLTNDEAEHSSVGDYSNQPADARFVLDRVLEQSEGTGYLAGLVDPARIGMAGLSLGGGTAYAVGYNSCCRDPRIDAVLVMAGFRFPFEGEYTLAERPLLIVHGTSDPTLPYDNAREAFAASAAPTRFVTLIDAGHAEPFENAPTAYDDLVIGVTTAFWDEQLRGDPTAADRLTAAADEPGLAEIVEKPGT